MVRKLNIMKKPTNEQYEFFIKLMENNINTPIYIGEEFGEYFYEHFLNCLPPITFGLDFTLSSEPWDDGVYFGIYKNNNTWFGIITSLERFNTILETRQNWNNPNRDRYYGLCIGDKVHVKYGLNNRFGIVNNFSYSDNNRVQLRLETGEICTWVAEHCEIINK